MFNNSIKSRLSVNHSQQKITSTPYLLNPISKVKMKPTATIQPVYISHNNNNSNNSNNSNNNLINILNSGPSEKHDESINYRKFNDKQSTLKNRQVFQQSSSSVDVS